jgi:hypothetical protein
MMKRFAAKLLFEYRGILRHPTATRVICEERIVNFNARNATEAFRIAKRKGRTDNSRYYKDAQIKFIGVLELLCLGVECGKDEVWYEIVERVRPLERRKRLIPPQHKLCAFRCNA